MWSSSLDYNNRTGYYLTRLVQRRHQNDKILERESWCSYPLFKSLGLSWNGVISKIHVKHLDYLGSKVSIRGQITVDCKSAHYVCKCAGKGHPSPHVQCKSVGVQKWTHVIIWQESFYTLRTFITIRKNEKFFQRLEFNVPVYVG